MSASVLVVDDEHIFRVLAEEALVSEGFEVRTAASLARARAEMEKAGPDVLVLDRRLPDGDGIAFLKELRAEGPSGPVVVVVTAYGDVENAVEALRAGAWDYLTKPIQLTDLVVKLRKVLEARGMKDRLALARSGAARPPTVEPASPGMKDVVERVRRLSRSPLTPVFLEGPSGVGKQYAAELLHEMTFRGADPDAPFVEVNCAALPDGLIESELFGHERGAFTDARAARRGVVEMADGGTLFLDEVTELPPAAQAKLLKFLDTMRFRRVGGEREIEVTLRVVVATNHDVRETIRTGSFREDLYHRLAVFLIAVPRLAERREDIRGLAEAFVTFFAARMKKKTSGLTPAALSILESYDYPGNVRELRNVIERAVILAQGPSVTEAEIVLYRAGAPLPAPPFFSAALAPSGSPPPLDEIERRYVSRVLDHLQGKRMTAAQALGISYPTFLRRLRELGLD